MPTDKCPHDIGLFASGRATEFKRVTVHDDLDRVSFPVTAEPVLESGQNRRENPSTRAQNDQPISPGIGTLRSRRRM